MEFICIFTRAVEPAPLTLRSDEYFLPQKGEFIKHHIEYNSCTGKKCYFVCDALMSNLNIRVKQETIPSSRAEIPNCRGFLWLLIVEGRKITTYNV